MNDTKYLITFDNVYVSTTNIIVEAKNEDEAYEKYENGQYIKRTDTKPEHETTGEPHLEEYKESEYDN
tara:strand:+ start:334 stop:537 length:204 start_codon:yes stop_codon:yes gene_type:complete